MIRVYPLPPWLLTNSYLAELYGAMHDPQIEVRLLRPRYALPELFFGRGRRILHLHFFDELTQRRSGAATALRCCLLLLLLAALRLRGVRIVWTAHNLEPHELHHPAWGFLMYRMVARWSEAIIAHSQAARDLLQSRYGPLPHCVVIPHGHYIGAYGPPHDRAVSRAELGLPAQGPVLLSFGALRPYKNIEQLISTFAELPEATRGTLLIAGAAKSPTYAEKLSSMAAKVPGVDLRLAYVPDSMLPCYLAAADLVVTPYRKLLTSAVLLCAFSYARPVVAPAFGPVRELVHDGAQGFLFTPGDRESLYAALQRALVHPDLDALGRAGLATAQAFGWPEIAAETAACYHRVAGDIVKG